jgi:hypothetical protein
VGAILFVALLACKQGASDDSDSSSDEASEAEQEEEQEEEEERADACPRNWLVAKKEVGIDGELECRCEKSQISGSVWGSGPYTADSSICHAAVHAGAIPRSGGTVEVKGVEDCMSYEGTTANGVKTSKWGKYEKGSYVFPGHGEQECVTSEEACPHAFNRIPGYGRDTELTCSCTPAQMKGSVWGSDIYTVDSSICQAARHAGAVDSEGGEVTVKGAYGCNSYRGSSRNGVTSARWGRYALSFYFEGHGEGVCK